MIYYQLWDVFTDEPLSGNPLAVVYDAKSLSDARMQQIAREFNLSETSFVLPSATADARARYFTPLRELPMAGHPSIGTVYALEHLGRVPQGQLLVKLELAIGVVKMGLERHEGALTRVWMNQGTPRLGAIYPERAQVATALGLTLSQLDESLPVQQGSAGVPFLLVPVRDLQALAQASPSADALARLAGDERPAVLVFTRETNEAGVDVRCRMFAPALGVAEDPATGSAHGPLGAYLAHHGVLDFAGETASLVSRQGGEMGRPSRIDVGVRRTGEGFEVYVGGSAVLVGEGRLYLEE